MKRLRPTSVWLFTLILMAPLASQADIYRWTGDNGVINYSDNPPPGVNAKLFKSISPPASKTKSNSVKASSNSSMGNFLKNVERKKKAAKEKKAADKKKKEDEKAVKRSEKSSKLSGRSNSLKDYAKNNSASGKDSLKKTKKQRIQEAKDKKATRLNRKLSDKASSS